MDQEQVYYLTYQRRRKRNTAGQKAPRDISQICRELGYRELLMPAFPSEKGKIYKKLWLLTSAVRAWENVYRSVPEGAALIYQHPGYGIRLTLRYITRLQQKKGCRAVALIHDLESLRKGIAGVISSNERRNEIGDNTLMKRFDAVICHNGRMKAYLVSQGLEEKKLIPLGIFDYLSDAAPAKHVRRAEEPSVAVAGNLAEGKSAYIYRMTEDGHNPGLKVHLFGINYDEAKKTEHTVYHGSFTPEELVGKLDADFGLVWDGPAAETCAGNTGEYLRYNNPHKTSLYLAAGMPVIVWKEAAIAGYVEENKVGLTVGSLFEAEEKIRKISDEEYESMRENARKVSEKILGGQYFRAAIEKALEGH